MSGLPLVSICIPSYNGAAFIAQALESALAQTYLPLEIIVSDDASTDATLNIVKTFQNQTDIPIRIYQHQPLGIGANWNHCVQQAQGAYIKFLFQDDLLYPDCIERMVELMQTDPTIGMVYSKRDLIYNAETEFIKQFVAGYCNLHEQWQDLTITNGVLEGKDYLKDRHFLTSPKNKIGEPGNVLLNAEVFNTVGYFNTQMKQALDSDFWYRLMTFYKVGFIDQALCAFRLHDAQASSLNKQANIKDNDLMYQSYYQHLLPYLHPQCRWKLLKLYHPVWRRLTQLKQLLYGQ